MGAFETITVRTKVSSVASALPLPAYASDHAAGFDLQAAIEEPIIIKPGKTALVSTGLSFELPVGFEMQVRPRSGLALKHSITVLNTPGTIDADYRGEVGVILINHGDSDFTVTPGMRIAQAVVARFVHVQIEQAEELTATLRGSNGFGSTGLAAPEVK